jgi:hypothetical protein
MTDSLVVGIGIIDLNPKDWTSSLSSKIEIKGKGYETKQRVYGRISVGRVAVVGTQW